MYFTNITGGEPFIRTDLKDIVRELYKKSDRIVISTNGFFTDRIVELAKEFPQIGIRISIEGLEQTNNEIRGLNDGYNRGYTTLKKLREMGMKDVGFGMTVQDKNGKPISISLPLEEKAFDEKRTRYFFEGLLPEGFTRKCVADWMQKDVNDYLSILAGLGNECLGAIQILDENSGKIVPDYRKLTEREVEILAKEGAPLLGRCCN